MAGRRARPTASRWTSPPTRGASSSGRPIASESSLRVSRRTVLAAGGLPLAGCGRGAERAVSLWAMDVEGENAKYLLAPYAPGPGTPVDLQWLAWTAAHQKLLTAFAGGSLPDVAMISGDWLAEFVRVGLAQPLRRDQLAILDHQLTAARAPLERGGRVWAAPWTVDVQAQYFRRDLLADVGLAAPPDRWEAWLQALRAVKRRRPSGFAVLMQLNWPEHLLNILAQAPEPLLRDQDAFGNFRAPGVKAALAFYRTLFAEGLAPVVTSIEADDPVAELARGWVAVYWAGAWTRADLRRRSGEIPAAQWGVAPLPGLEAPARAIVAGRDLMLTRDARDVSGASKLIAYLNAPEVQARFFRLAGVLPSRKEAWSDPALASDPAMKVFAAQLERPRASPAILEWPRIVTAIQEVAERLARGALGVDGAATEMDRVADAILAKRRSLLERGLA